MLKGKYIYKAGIDGDMTIEEQIEQVKIDSIRGGYSTRDFSASLRYDITRTVANTFGNSVIDYIGDRNDKFCESLQKELLNIYFTLHDKGRCFLTMAEDGSIEKINGTSGTIKIIDPAYELSKITQKQAAEKALDMYGVVTNTMYSVLDERGVMGMFSPQKEVVVKPTQKREWYDSMKSLFGSKKGQRKFITTEIPMNYTGVTLPIADLKLLENERAAVAKVARLYGMQEDMILSGSTFDNKENAIIQTYTDFKGLIYNWITQIEAEKLATVRRLDDYNITFPGVPQLNKKTTEQ